MGWTVLLSAVSRTLANWFIGLRRTREAALLTVATALLSLLAVAGLTGAMGLRGWVAGRFVGEALGAAALLYALRHTLRAPRHPTLAASAGYGYLAGHGALLAMGLITRSALDQGGVLALGVWHAPAQQVGFFGIATLVLTALMVFPGALGNLLVPRFAALGRARAARRELARSLGWMLLGMIPAVGTAALLAGPAVALLFPAYTPAVPLLRVLLLAAPARAVQSLCGGVLLANNRNQWALACKCAMLAGSWELYAAVVPEQGALGGAWVITTVEYAGLLLFGAAAWLTLRTPGTPPDPHAAGAGGALSGERMA
jgi:O-antigen/teichoic acid export membrane protein